ncbi:U-box domain-containing protein 40-like [Magnolia sinica]|uniref:U-box domain-containing protein 40-like n=1 Tax=Magnolia sinica TaxID=86752 RepID=UPI00265895C1|nr:U-box domain-containing protein 40-like [Magnolia sinica]
MGGRGKNRWKISFLRSSPSSPSSPSSNSNDSPKTPPKEKPEEFICPISSSLMSDPVILSSGQTFERSFIQACIDLRFFPSAISSSSASLSLSSPLIPNLALRSTILNWCDASGVPRPKPPDPSVAMDMIRSLMSSAQQTDDRHLLQGVAEKPPVLFSHAATELNRRPNYFYSSSDESVAATPLPLTTKPSCFSSSSSSSPPSSSSPSSSEIIPAASSQEEEIVRKLRSVLVYEQEEAVSSLRNISRSSPESRVPLCTPRLLAAIRPLLLSRYPAVQINATAAVVNLSLEKPNKERIMRSGAVPPLIDILKGGFPEAQEHAAGAIFSLALDDDNKPAIGVLGALQPLLHTLRHERQQARQDAALALYHLSLLQCNRSKLVKLGAVPLLLGYARGGELASRAMIILCNLASGTEGRAALMDADAVQVFVEMLREKSGGEAMREHCVAVLFALSSGGSVLRFKASAKAAGAVEVLKEVAETGKSERAREKAKRMLIMLKGKGDVAAAVEAIVGSGEEGEWIREEERVSDSVIAFRQLQLKGKNVSGANSTDF